MFIYIDYCNFIIITIKANIFKYISLSIILHYLHFSNIIMHIFNQKCYIFLQNRNDNDRVIPSIRLGIKFPSFLSSSHCNTRERLSRPLRRRKGRAVGLAFDIVTISPNIVVTSRWQSRQFRLLWGKPTLTLRKTCLPSKGGGGRGAEGLKSLLLADALAGVTGWRSRAVKGWNSAVRIVCRVFHHVRGWADQYCDWTPEADFIQSTPPFHPPLSGPLELCYYTQRL